MDSPDRPSAATAREQISLYLQSLTTQRKLARHTVENYRRDLIELIELGTSQGIEPCLASITHFQIRKFAAQLHGSGQNPRSIARKLSAWRGFFNWLAEQVALPSNPVEGVKAPRQAKLLPKALAADDAVHLVSHAHPAKDPHSSAQSCNRAMFELLYSSGLRISELVGLDTRYTQEGNYTSSSWIDLDAAEVTVTGKGGKKRSVPVGQPAIAAIRTWLEVRPGLVKADGSDGMHALFLTERGTRMSARIVQMRLKQHAQALGIPVDVHPHVLRHSFASHVLQSSGDLRAVQEMLGHASIAATQIYTSLDFQRLAQVYDAAHPRSKRKS
jgi:integrase/recombinase XerC